MSTNPEHDPVFYVEKYLFLLSVVTDEGVQCVTVRHPAYQTRVGGKRDHRESLNPENNNNNNNELSA